MMIRKTSIVFLFMLSWAQLAAQDPWEHWDPGTVSKLHTAANVFYLDDEEKKVVLLMNMARHDGPLFARTFLARYVQDKQVENSAYLRTLKRDLDKVKGLVPLHPEKDLTGAALGHALASGKSGKVGHQGFNKRFEPLMGKPYLHVGENCSYGYETARDIVVSLLIDEGIKDHGHRKNILAPDFNSVGVAIRPHRKYRVNCVMDFGQHKSTR